MEGGQAVCADHWGSSRLRDQWRAGRAALPADERGRVQQHLQHPSRPLREPVGLRNDPALECTEGEVVAGRSFNPEAATEESSALIALLDTMGVRDWCCHIDLHETTDTDETEFRPAKAARDGDDYTPGIIPDGFYLVANVEDPRTEWHRAIIERVRGVTHIAPPDENGLIIGEPVVQEGVIVIPAPSSIGLCAGVTNAGYATTTEVYPDSPTANADQCNEAQVAVIEAALDFITTELELRPVECASDAS